MKVFISWSGERSKKTAEILKKWLPLFIQELEPWISTEIEKGKRWTQEIADQLEKSNIGIFCLNRDNLNSRWLLFEAGAMSKGIVVSRVCTFLLDLSHSDVTSPLADFMHTTFDKEDFLKLLQTLNKSCNRSLADDVLHNSFETYWPKFETELKPIVTESTSFDERQERRPDSDILSEVLEIVRRIDNSYPRTGSAKLAMPALALAATAMEKSTLFSSEQIETLMQLKQKSNR